MIRKVDSSFTQQWEIRVVGDTNYRALDIDPNETNVYTVIRFATLRILQLNATNGNIVSIQLM